MRCFIILNYLPQSLDSSHHHTPGVKVYIISNKTNTLGHLIGVSEITEPPWHILTKMPLRGIFRHFSSCCFKHTGFEWRVVPHEGRIKGPDSRPSQVNPAPLNYDGLCFRTEVDKCGTQQGVITRQSFLWLGSLRQSLISFFIIQVRTRGQETLLHKSLWL